MTRVLALDVGTSSVRARIYDERGTADEGAEARTRYDVVQGRGGAAELDPGQLVEAARAVLAEVRAEARGHVDAVAGSCFWHSLLALDRRDRPLSPLFIWQDTRSAPQAERLAERLDAAAVHARTGCPLHPSYWPAVLAWLAEERPEVFRSAARFVSFAEYLYLQLAGEARMSLSSASGTGLLDVNERRWDDELLGELGLDPARLPEISDEPTGAEEPWFPALGDGACSNVGAGCVTRERAVVMVGTSGAYRTVFEAERATPLPGLFLYRLDGTRFVEGGALSDGGNLHAWLTQTLRLPDDPQLGEPDSHGLTFLPLLGGERAPGWRARARGAVTGLTFDTTPEQIHQAALEGIAYRFAAIAELMPEVREVVATGGGLRGNPGWTQILADVLEREIVVSAVEEGSARGAAVVALERLGHLPDPPPLGSSFEPQPERAGAYRSARDRQRALYEMLT